MPEPELPRRRAGARCRSSPSTPSSRDAVRAALPPSSVSPATSSSSRHLVAPIDYADVAALPARHRPSRPHLATASTSSRPHANITRVQGVGFLFQEPGSFQLVVTKADKSTEKVLNLVFATWAAQEHQGKAFLARSIKLYLVDNQRSSGLTVVGVRIVND